MADDGFCMAYQDPEAGETRCVRPRGHDGSHTTARGNCWPNLARPAKRKPARLYNEKTHILPHEAMRPAKEQWL